MTNTNETMTTTSPEINRAEGEITLSTGFGPITFKVFAKTSGHGIKGLCAELIAASGLVAKINGIEYHLRPVISHYRSSRGLEKLRLEDLGMTRAGSGADPTDPARSYAWLALKEAVAQLNEPTAWRWVWLMTCNDAAEQAYRESERLQDQALEAARLAAAFSRLTYEPAELVGG